MRQLFAIANRETGAFFRSAMAPVVLTGFLVAVGLFFVLILFGYSEMSRNAVESARSGNYVNLAEGIFRPLVSNMTLFLLLLMPAVTMRLFSPEFSTGRYDTIASWPVPDHIWVLGKWLSAMAVATLLIVAAGVYVLVVRFLGEPELGPVITAAIGLLLLSASLGAIGVFFSTLFRHQMITYFVTFAVAMVLFLIGALEPHLPGYLGRMCRDMSFLSHFALLSRGVLDTRDVLFFVGLTSVPLFAAFASLSSRRQPRRRRPMLWLPTGIALVLVILVYLLGLRFPYAADLTGNKRYSLAPQTLQILAELPTELNALRQRGGRELAGTDGSMTAQTRAVLEADTEADVVEIIGFYERLDPARSVMETLLESFETSSHHVRYGMVDPEENLELVHQYGIAVSRTLVVQVGRRAVTLLQPGESALINAVYRLVTGTRPLVLHLLGHGEHLLDSTERPGYSELHNVLVSEGYEVRSIYLADVARIPDEAEVMIIAGPRTEPTPTEIEAIEAFQARGGAVLALFDPPTPARWNGWLGNWDLKVSNDVLVNLDRDRTRYGVSARTTVATEGYSDHEITRSLSGVSTVFPLAQPLGYRKGSTPAPDESQVLILTSATSWAERDPETRFSGAAEFDSGTDVPGPLPLAVAVEQPVTDAAQQPMRLVVFGNSEFLSNANIDLGGNRDLLLNTMGWLAREETLINLRGTDPLSQPVVLSLTEKKLFGWGAVLVWPLLVGGAALAVMLRHRRQGTGY